MFAKTDSIFRFRLLPPHVITHSWKNGGERKFWWDLKQDFWMSLMIKNMIRVSFSFWHYENFSGFFIPKWKEIWLSLEKCHMQFSDIFVLVPSNCFPPLFLSEGGRHICNRFPVWGAASVCSPQPCEVSVGSGWALWLLKTEFSQHKSFHSSPKKSLTKAHSCLIFGCCCQ